MNNHFLKETARRIRAMILRMANRSKGAHVGSSLSIVEILTYLYMELLDVKPGNTDSPERDIFILSKGHGAMALYAALVERKIVSTELLDGYMLNDGTLPAHLDKFSAPGIEVSTGALGHGLSLGVGMAYGNKLKGRSNKVYVLMGDGEIQEGSVWEAAMIAPKLGLENLTVVVDFNNLQGYGRPCELMHFEPVAEKWRAFGWRTLEADGHDFNSLRSCFNDSRPKDTPAVVIARTIKGKGVSFMEDELKWHYFIVTDELLKQALEEIENA